MSKARLYETLIVVSADLDEQSQAGAWSAVQAIVAKNEGRIVKDQDLGKKKLAFEVNKKRDGIYRLMIIELDAQKVQAVKRAFEIDDNILKYSMLSENEVKIDLNDSEAAE